jgi:hypothetical protein
MASKSRWAKPQLVVLGRTEPQESVLLGCKWANDPVPSGPQSVQASCIVLVSCLQCSSPDIT